MTEGQMMAGEAAGTIEPKKLYVSNIAWAVTDEDLQKHFSQRGEVVMARIPRYNGKSKGYGFVEFADEASAQRALQSAQGVELEGRPLNVKQSELRERTRPDMGGREDRSPSM